MDYPLYPSWFDLVSPQLKLNILILRLIFLIINAILFIELEVMMDISKATCPDCGNPMRLTRATCPHCQVDVEAPFDVAPLGRLSPEDQVFVIAFLRHHGSIRKMEELFDISYPTVKNRLRGIVDKLDRTFSAPSSNAIILEQVARGEITVDEALERME